MMRNIYKYAAAALFCVMLAACGKEEGFYTNDPSAPVIVNRFYPTSGGVGTEIIITGKNFSEDTAQVSVKLGDRSLKVIGSNRNNIVVVVPQKLNSGKLNISIAGREAVSTLEAFNYTYSAIVTSVAGNGSAGYADGPAATALFSFNDTADGGWRKGALCIDGEDNIYVGDIMNNCIRRITPEGEVSTFITAIGFYGMDCDAQGNIWFTDVFAWRLCKATPQGVVTTISTPFEPWYLAVDKNSGDVYITVQNDGGNGFIHRYDGETFTQVAGRGNYTAVAVDKQGSLYASNAASHSIEKFTKNGDAWTKEIFAGSTQGMADGPFGEAKFSWPRGLAFSSTGDLFVAGNGTWNAGDNADQAVRRLDMVGGRVITIAGGGSAGYANAIGSAALFSGPQDVAVDSRDNVYVFDKMNNSVRMIVYE